MTKHTKATAKGRIDFTTKRVNAKQVILQVGARRDSLTGGGGTAGVWVTSELLHSPGADWDKWYETAFELVPEAGSAIDQLASLVSGFDFIAKEGDTDSVDMLNELIDKAKIAFRQTILNGVWNYYTYGGCYIQPVWQGMIRNSELASLRSPQPSTMTPIHATQKEIADFKAAYVKAKVAMPAGIDNVKLNGDRVGFIQKSGELVQPFLATEIIFIPRSTPKYPDGVSCLRNLYRKIISVGGSEEMLTRQSRIYSNPPWHLRVGSDKYPCEPNDSGQAMIDFVKTQLGPLAEAGEYENITQLILPNWVEFVLPRFDIPIAAPMMDHLQRERDSILVSIGVPPAVLSAEGFRATAQEALRMLEDRIVPIRDLFEHRLTDELLLPWLTWKHNGAEEGTTWFMPEWNWHDITPDDMNAVRLSLTQAAGLGWMSKNEARVIHGGLPVIETDQPPEPQTPISPLTPTSPEQTSPTIQGMTPQLLEAQYGKPLKQIIIETMTPEGHKPRSHRAAARILGISPTTLYAWRQKCGLFPDGIPKGP